MRKASAKLAARTFIEKLDRLDEYAREIEASGLSKQAQTWAYEAALIKTYVALEELMLRCLVASVNNDTATISAVSGIQFPKHLTDAVCEYLIVGDRYFDFKGYSGLVDLLKKYVPKDHWLYLTVKNTGVRKVLDQLVPLQNFAAHEGKQSKDKARKAVDQQQIGSAGAWIKSSGGRRFTAMTRDLRKLGHAIEMEALY